MSNRAARTLSLFIRVAACITPLTTAGAAHAQGPSLNAPAPAAPASEHHTETTGAFALRTTAELAAGSAAAAAVWAPTFSLAISETEECMDALGFAGFVCAPVAGVISLAGLGVSTIATPTAVYIAGEVAGGNGNYWYTLLGSTAGSVSGLVLMSLAPAFGDAGLAVVAGLLVVPNIIGSMAAYELSQDAEIAEDRAASRPAVTLVPSIGTTADGRGGLVSLGGQF